MKYSINNFQKQELTKLFNLEKQPEKLKDLIENIEYGMEDNFLPPKGSRESVITKRVHLLRQISQTAKKLRTELNRLDNSSLENFDCKLGGELGKPYFSDTITVGNEPTKCYESISTIKAIKAIEEEAEFTACDYKQYYSTASSWEINALFSAWPHDIGGSITNTKDSKFIKYLSIILEEESHEALTKRAERCVGYHFSKINKG